MFDNNEAGIPGRRPGSIKPRNKFDIGDRVVGYGITMTVIGFTVRALGNRPWLTRDVFYDVRGDVSWATHRFAEHELEAWTAEPCVSPHHFVD
jgi:hypothetical protein